VSNQPPDTQPPDRPPSSPVRALVRCVTVFLALSLPLYAWFAIGGDWNMFGQLLRIDAGVLVIAVVVSVPLLMAAKKK
jgi:hypothetical protein